VEGTGAVAGAELTVGFPRSTPGDRRTLLTPAVAARLTRLGVAVLAEPGVGAGVFCPDGALTAVGARLAGEEEVWSAPLVLRYRAGSTDDLRRLRPGQRKP
jgi:alanine dehydrogenase